VDNPEEIVSVGEELELKVISLDTEERRIGLSLKEAKVEQEQSVINRYMEGQFSDRPTMADLMGRKNVSLDLQSGIKPKQNNAPDEESSEDTSTEEVLEADVSDDEGR